MFNPIFFYEQGKQRDKPFVAEFDTRNVLSGGSANNQVRIPFRNEATNAVVEWGDGTQSVIIAYNQAEATHTYDFAGIYTIKIHKAFSLDFFANNLERLKIKAISSWGKIIINTNTFRSCANLTAVSVTDIPTVNSIAGAFFGCTSLTTVNKMDEWNTSNINSLAQTFQGCTNFNQPLNNWNTSNVIVMNLTFSGCANFNQSLNNWNTSNVINMTNTFNQCAAFNQPLNSWNVSNVTNFGGIFRQCTNFNQPLNNWNTLNVTDMQFAFDRAANFNQDISMWNFGKVTNLNGFMSSKTNLNYNASYYDDLLIKWDASGKTGLSLNMGTIKYTSAGATARANLIAKGWLIMDGGIT